MYIEVVATTAIRYSATDNKGKNDGIRLFIQTRTWQYMSIILELLFFLELFSQPGRGYYMYGKDDDKTCSMESDMHV